MVMSTRSSIELKFQVIGPSLFQYVSGIFGATSAPLSHDDDCTGDKIQKSCTAHYRLLVSLSI